MPLNKLRKYNDLLDFGAYDEYQRRESLMRIFERDFIELGDIYFYINRKKVGPTPSSDGEIKVETLFTHLITCSKVGDKRELKRFYDNNRAIRLHWVRHLLLKREEGIEIFSVEERDGKRTYIYDKEEQYVIVLEPLRVKNEYYLLTAHKLMGKDDKRDKIMSKKRRALQEVL